MQKFLELRAKQDDLKRKGLAIFDKAMAEHRDTTAAEDKELAGLNEERNKLRTKEARYIVEKGLQGQIAAMEGTPALGLAGIMPGESDAAHYAGGRTYRDMFHGGDKYASLSRGDFENFEEFLQVLSTGRHDPRLKEVSIRAMTEGVPSSGGFLVPDEFGAFLLDGALEREIVRPRAKVWPMTTQTRKIPSWDGADHTDGVYGGFSGQWLSEGGTADRQNAKLRQIQLTAKKLGIYTQASRELREDGVTFEAQLSDAMVNAIAFYLDYAFLAGTGAGMPLGILNDPALIVVDAEAGQPASTFLYENCTKMMARLYPGAFENAIWIANQTLLPQFMEMSVSVGTGGSWIKAVEQRGNDFYLLGKRLLFTEKLPTAGTEGDVLLADLSKYTIGMRQEVIVDLSNAVGWLQDMVDYRTILRADGQGSWSSAITPKNGDSLSWCVVLEART